VAKLVTQSGKSLGSLVGEMIQNYPCSGEVNSKIADVDSVLKAVQAKYLELGGKPDYTDGVSMEFSDWRFNLRCSNTEPVIRLNVETRGDHQMMVDKTNELLKMIRG
jgi:phosphomannomutase